MEPVSPLGRGKAPKLTRADVERAVKLVKALGLATLAVDVMPRRIRIITDERILTVSDDEALDQELAEHRARNGYG